MYTYDEAPIVCEALGGQLATLNQVRDAHNRGAHWCNYGWSDEQMALYPIQEDKWEDLQKCEETKDTCGKPGVNGGYFPDKNMKLGVNCYGPKPKPDNGRIVYQEPSLGNRKMMRNKYENMYKQGDIVIRPFNSDFWSNYSYKKSRYIIHGEDSTEIPDVIMTSVDETEKNPNTYISGPDPDAEEVDSEEEQV